MQRYDILIINVVGNGLWKWGIENNIYKIFIQLFNNAFE